MATVVEGNPKAPFSIATSPRCRGGRYSFPGLLYFTLDPYLIMLSVKQGGIKYHFLSLWYDSTWDWTQVSRAIGEVSYLNQFRVFRIPYVYFTYSYLGRSRRPILCHRFISRHFAGNAIDFIHFSFKCLTFFALWKEA